MKQYLEYCKYSNTIRQMPENYCIAVHRQNRWLLDFDLACSHKLALKVFHELFNYGSVYGTGENLIEMVGGVERG